LGRAVQVRPAVEQVTGGARDEHRAGGDADPSTGGVVVAAEAQVPGAEELGDHVVFVGRGRLDLGVAVAVAGVAANTRPVGPITT
jgi:hypothetical protein